MAFRPAPWAAAHPAMSGPSPHPALMSSLRRSRALWRALVWRPLRQFPARALVSILAVALGIAVVIGIHLASRASTQSFAATSRALAGSADLLVRGPAPISPATLAKLNQLGGQARILPYIHRIAYDPHAKDTLDLYGLSLWALPHPGAHHTLELHGLRLFALPHPFTPPRPYAPAPRRPNAPSPTLSLAAPYAHRYGYHPGQILTLVAGARRLHFRIAGLLPQRGLAQAQAGHIAVLDVGALAGALAPGQPVRFDGLNIRLAPGVSRAAFAAEIRPLLPPGDALEPPAARQRQADKMLAAFQTNLLAMSFVALLVGAFLIYHAMTMAVLRRRQAIAVVRALGAPARAVRMALLAEAAAVATLGAGIGLALGWLFARAAVGGLSATVNNLYAVSHPLPPRLTLSGVALALGVAWVVGLLSAWGPARQAAGIVPAAALRPEEPELQFRARHRRWAWACLAFALVALAAARLPAPRGFPVNGYISAFAAVLAAAFAAPLLLGAILPAARRRLSRQHGGALSASGRPLPSVSPQPQRRPRGPHGAAARRGVGATGASRTERLSRLARGRARLALAAASLLASQRRVAVLIAALATAVAMVVGVAAMVASFRQTVQVWLGETLQAQVYVRPLAWSRRHPAPIPPHFLRLAVQTPGVRRAVFYRQTPFRFRGQTALLATRWSPEETARQAIASGLKFLQPPRLPANAAAGPWVFVSEPFARRFGLWRGARLPLATPAGPRTARVAGVFYDYSSSQGIVRLDAATYRRWFGPPAATNLALYALPGVPPGALRRRVAARLARAGGAFAVHDQAALQRQALAVFDQTFRITGALELVALVVALLGVANTLWAVALERRRELALLCFIGATPGQLRGLLLAEAAWVGLLSVGLGAILGAALAAILIYVINVQSFGWTIQLHPPWAYLAGALALLFAATLAAGWPPARWAARMNPLRALAAD